MSDLGNILIAARNTTGQANNDKSQGEKRPMDLKPGSRWRSAVCDAEVILVRTPKAPGVLTCGGHPMIVHSRPRPEGLAILAEHAAGVGMGKRLIDQDSGLEILCTKGGCGSVAMDGRALSLKDAKPLPSSD